MLRVVLTLTTAVVLLSQGCASSEPTANGDTDPDWNRLSDSHADTNSALGTDGHPRRHT